MSVASILARYHAEKAVRAQLRRDKIKLAEVNDLQRRAAAYLAEHRAELLAQAERTIAGSAVLQRMVAVQKTSLQCRAKSPAGSMRTGRANDHSTIDHYRTGSRRLQAARRGAQHQMGKPMKRVAIYLRVSTGEQSVDNQRRELHEAAERHGWRIVAECSDEGVSGASPRRPAFDRLCKAITRREVDLIAAWSVDRLGRSLAQLVSFLGELHGAGCDLYLHRQGLDTSTPAGRALFGMMGVFAEFERAMVVERTMAGLARARAKGKVLGRPKVTGEVEAAVLSSLAAGTGIVRTAREIGCGVGTVQRIRREAYHDHGPRDTHPTPTARRDSVGHQPCPRQRLSGMDC